MVLPEDQLYDIGVPLTSVGEPAGNLYLVIGRTVPQGREVSVKGTRAGSCCFFFGV